MSRHVDECRQRIVDLVGRPVLKALLGLRRGGDEIILEALDIGWPLGTVVVP